MRAPRQRQPPQRHRRRVADAASRSKAMVPDHQRLAERALSDPRRLAAAPRRHRAPRRGRLGLRPRRRRARRRHHPELRGHRHPPRGRQGGRRRDARAASSAQARSASSPPATPSVLADMAGFRLPIESHPLQALVSEPIKPVLDTVVMSNAVHGYISQSDKGELVIGAGIDAYVGYGQRGSFSGHREHAGARSSSCSRSSAGVRMNRAVGRHRRRVPRRLPDHRQDAGRGPVLQLRLGHRRLQGHARLGLRLRPHDRAGRPHELNAAFSLDRFPPATDRRARRRRRRPLSQESAMLLIPCPWCGPRDETEFSLRRRGAHRAARRTPTRSPTREWARLPLHAQEPAGRAPRAAGCTPRLPALVQRRARHRHATRSRAVYEAGAKPARRRSTGGTDA